MTNVMTNTNRGTADSQIDNINSGPGLRADPLSNSNKARVGGMRTSGTEGGLRKTLGAIMTTWLYRRIDRAALIVATCLIATPLAVQAGPISFDVWYEFQTEMFLPARGCPPADPTVPPIFGTGCTPVSGITFADTPPYTFNAPVTGALLTVTDAFDAGDILNVFDFGALIGTTSPSSVTPIYIGSADPDVALLDPRLSHGTFLLGGGLHSITFAENSAAELDPTGVEGPGGAHFFKVAPATSVPEPRSSTLLGLGLFVAICWKGMLRLSRVRR